MELFTAFQQDMAAGPAWVVHWVNFMGVVFMLAIPFSVVRMEARIALVVFLLTAPAMMALYAQVGYVRLLGVVHVILWTPLAYYLWKRRDKWRVRETIAGKWIFLLFVTIVISLIFDYTDVIRYAAGERG